MMQGCPFVTVITPTYNRVSSLEQTIRSVVEQGYKNLEYIIVDDASTDETAETVNRLQQLYPFIKYHRNAQNGGEVYSINAGYKMASHDLVCVLSDDDIIFPDWFEHMVKAAVEHPECCVIYPDWAVIDSDAKLIQNRVLQSYSLLLMMTSMDCMPAVGALIRRSVVKADSLRSNEFLFCSDWHMWLKLALRGPFVHVPSVLAGWRIHVSSITFQGSGRLTDKVDEMNRMIESFIAEAPEAIITQRYAKGLRCLGNLRNAHLLMSNSCYADGLKQIFTCVVRSPYWTASIFWRYIVQRFTWYFKNRSIKKA